MDLKLLKHEQIINKTNSDILFNINSDSGSYVSSHWHDDLEIIYILDGNLEISMEDKNIKLFKEMLYIIDSRIVHSVNCPNFNKALLVQIPHKYLEKFIPDINTLKFELNREQENLLKIQLDKLIECYQDNSTIGLLNFNIGILEFIKSIYLNHSKPVKKAISKSGKYFQRLQKVIEYSQNNYNKQISIKDVAEVASLQEKYFCRFFKQNMGMSYITYLNELRLSRVYKDLFETSENIGSLIEKHGFNNPGIFRKLFKNKFKLTPAQVRKSK